MSAAASASPSLRARIERLLASLQSRRGPTAGDHRLTRRNVYILPTRPGMTFGAVLIVMLIAAINYQLSLGYALTFLIAAVAVVGMLHTFRNLATLVLRAGRAEPVFAGQPAEFTLVVRNGSRLDRFAVSLAAPGMVQPELFDAPATAEQTVSIALPTRERGWLQVPRMTLATTYPLGLWRAWAYWQPLMRVLVYPAPETPAVPLPAKTASRGEGNAHGAGQDDVAALRPYVTGDSPRIIAWKAMARTASDELIAKQFDGGDVGELVLDWAELPASMSIDARLARLTRWVLDADVAGVRYALRLPGISVELDSGAAQRVRCLEALAVWGH
ncbi:MAG: DUF58 domain-containing protein [Burkholderiaceae bacterium]